MDSGTTRAIGAAIEMLPVAVLIVADDGTIQIRNAACETLLGVPGHAVGRRAQEVDAFAGIPGLRGVLEAARTSGARRHLPAVVVHGAAGLRTVDVDVVPLNAGSGGHLVTARDVTPLERLAEDSRRLERDHEARNAEVMRELQAANEALEAANEELQERLGQLEAAERADLQKNRFLSMLAHELRNPLAPILNALYLLRRSTSSDPPLEQVRRIAERQARHQARLIDDLLDVSRIVLGKIELRLEPVDLVAVVRSAVDSQTTAVAGRAHDLQLELPDTPVKVNGDATRLEQATRNLLANAIKYTPPGGCIGLTVARQERTAVIRVTDTGVGIAPEMLPRIFDLFAQADTSLARAQGGLGIGLTLARELILLLGGTIEARSRGLGHGSEFEVRLPVTDATERPARRPVASTGRVRRVLVIEDNPDGREVLCAVLAMEGHQVRSAPSAQAGVRMAAEIAPDVVLIDIGLPEWDGYEVARRVRRRLGSAVRLIALTGYGEPEARERAREAGFDAHLVKPVSPEELAAVLAAAP